MEICGFWLFHEGRRAKVGVKGALKPHWRAGDVALLYSACLTSARPWMGSPALCMPGGKKSCSVFGGLFWETIDEKDHTLFFLLLPLVLGDHMLV